MSAEGLERRIAFGLLRTIPRVPFLRRERDLLSWRHRRAQVGPPQRLFSTPCGSIHHGACRPLGAISDSFPRGGYSRTVQRSGALHSLCVCKYSTVLLGFRNRTPSHIHGCAGVHGTAALQTPYLNVLFRELRKPRQGVPGYRPRTRQRVSNNFAAAGSNRSCAQKQRIGKRATTLSDTYRTSHVWGVSDGAQMSGVNCRSVKRALKNSTVLGFDVNLTEEFSEP